MKIINWKLKTGEGIFDYEEEEGISLKMAKTLLREKGGKAYISNYKGGDFICCDEIVLGNNAKAKQSKNCQNKKVGKRILKDDL